MTSRDPRLVPPRRRAPRLGPIDLLIFSAWCGLASGLIEVGARTVAKTLFPEHRLYLMSRHFVWLTPLSDLAPFVLIGDSGCPGDGPAPVWPMDRASARRLPGDPARAGGPGPPDLPDRLVGPRPGSGLEVVRFLERRMTGSSRPAPELSGIVGPGPDPRRHGIRGRLAGGASREWLCLPPGRPPNVLMITLDTVRADHLSLYGYGRHTSPVLEKVAGAAVRFDEARSAASWTLPSHATMFTGRWPHELGVRWLTPLDKSYPTLAEYLGSHGYATAGFAGNTTYCSHDGLEPRIHALRGLSPRLPAALADSLVG